MARSYLKVFLDFEEKTEKLSENERARLLLAMLRYAKTGEIPTFSGKEELLFPVFKGEIDRDAAEYETFCEKQKTNGSKGGRPPKNPVVIPLNPKNPVVISRNPKNPVVFSKTQKSQEEDKEKEKEEDEELFSIQMDHDDLLESARRIGLPMTDQNMSDLIDLYADFGKDAVSYGIKEAGRLNKVSIAYISKVATNYGNEKPKEESDELPDISTFVF